MKCLSYRFSKSRTEWAVLASSPVVGSSRKRTEGSMMSSIPMFVLFLSPPEIPRLICVPTWGQKRLLCWPRLQSEARSRRVSRYGPWSRPPWWDPALWWGDWPEPPSHSEGRRWAAAGPRRNAGSPWRSACPWPRPPAEEKQSFRSKVGEGNTHHH